MKGERIVLDTNCLLQIISTRSRYKKVWEHFRSGSGSLCVTTDILLEYEEVIGRHSCPEVAENIVMAIIKNENTIKINYYDKYNLIVSDPDDNKFVDCAIASRARYIVTEDSHFNILRSIRNPRVEITRLEDYLKELEENEVARVKFRM